MREITQKEHDAIKRRLETANKEILRLESEVNALTDRNRVLELEKDQWVRDKIRWQAMVQDQMNISNRKNNEYLEQIEQLRNKVKT